MTEAVNVRDDVKLTRWIAMIAGLVGFLCAVATPLLPVVQTTGSSGVATAHRKPIRPAIIAIHRVSFTSSLTFTAPVTAAP